MKKLIKISLSLFLLLSIQAVSAKVCVKDTVINAGIGGNNTADLLKRIDADVLQKKPDLVILMVGTNDLLNTNKMLSYEKYAENLTKIVKTLKANDIQVLMMSSLPVDSAYLLQRHDRSKFTEAPNDIMDSVSHIVRRIAAENNALFLDLHKVFVDMGLPKHDEDLYIRNPINSKVKDGVHPTVKGYQLIAERLFQFMKDNNLLKKYHRILCFGDSITNGSGAKGGGTVLGENYPSFLYRYLLNQK